MGINNSILNQLRKIQDKHKNVALCFHLINSKLYKPSHLKVLLSDLSGRRAGTLDNYEHCEAAIKWLLIAHERAQKKGVSWGYSFSWGWRWPYPETSGYIICSLFDFVQNYPESAFKKQCQEAAIRIGDWLIEIQNPDGSYLEGLYPIGKGSMADKAASTDNPTAFETGQAAAGLLRAYCETLEHKYLDAATKACDWLLRHQSQDGTWSASYQRVPRSFDCFIAWPLVILWCINGKAAYKECAVKNLEWCLNQQTSNGFFENCSHSLGQPPLTHGIGYAMQGLMEAGLILAEPRYIQAAQRTADALINIYYSKGFLPARLFSNWASKDKFTCLTGNAQTSLVCLKLFKYTRDARYLAAAHKINIELKSTHNLTSPNLGIRGGIKGSHPIYGLYTAFQYPNWAAKFFLDALIAEEQVGNSK